MPFCSGSPSNTNNKMVNTNSKLTSFLKNLKRIHKEKKWKELVLVTWLTIMTKISEFITGERKR